MELTKDEEAALKGEKGEALELAYIKSFTKAPAN